MGRAAADKSPPPVPPVNNERSLNIPCIAGLGVMGIKMPGPLKGNLIILIPLLLNPMLSAEVCTYDIDVA